MLSVAHNRPAADASMGQCQVWLEKCLISNTEVTLGAPSLIPRAGSYFSDERSAVHLKEPFAAGTKLEILQCGQIPEQQA